MEKPDLTPAAHTNDGFFKAVFSQPEHAIAFFKSHLPPAIAAKVDWNSLEVLPGSFVKSSLQQVHSDLLFSVRIGDVEARLYLLFEHQSSPDPAMPLRLLGYFHPTSQSARVAVAARAALCFPPRSGNLERLHRLRGSHCAA